MPKVDVAVDERVATITIVNEEHRNALDAGIAKDLVQVCGDLERDPDVGGAVLRGAGGYFCAGGDRSELATAAQAPLTTENMGRISAIYDAFVRFGHLGIPTVAAIRGGAVGAGLNLALAADVRIVSTTAQLVPGFTRIGYHPGGGHLHLLHRAAGADASAAMGLMGASIDGRRAAEIGMVWEACEDGEVENRALELLRPIAADPDLARHIKNSYLLQTRTAGISWQAALQVERGPQMWSFARSAR